MTGKNVAQLVDVRLVEFKRIDEAFFQDYAKIHDRLERMLDKEPRPLSEETVSIVADEFIAWLSTQAAKNVPHDRLSQYLRVGLGHLCSEMIVIPHNLPAEEAAIRAYAELQRRGWDLATYDPEVAAQAVKRVASLGASRTAMKLKAQSKKPSSAGSSAGVKKKVIGNPKIAAHKAGVKAAAAKKEALMALEKKAAAKKPAAKKAAAKKPAAKKAAAKKPAAKKATAKKPAAKKTGKKAAAKNPAAKKTGAKKPAAKKTAAKKPAAKKTAAKKPAAKKAVAKKPAAKKPAAKKPAAKKAVAKKPAAKKPAAKPAAPKPAEPKPAPAFTPIEEKKPDLF